MRDIWQSNTTRNISKLAQNFTRQTSREITFNNFEISLVVFMPNITTNHALPITYTNTCLIYHKDRDFSPLLVYHLHHLLGRLSTKSRYICRSTFRKKKHPKRSNHPADMSGGRVFEAVSEFVLVTCK